MTKKELATQLWQYLLSLEKGFAFASQNKRVVLDNGDVRHVDLEMYNRELQSTVLIKLYKGEPETAEMKESERLVAYYNTKASGAGDIPAVGLVINISLRNWYTRFIGLTGEQQAFLSDGIALGNFRDNYLNVKDPLQIMESAKENILVRARKELRLTQQQVANRAGISLQQYQMFESGEQQLRTAPFEVAFGILDVLELTVLLMRGGTLWQQLEESKE